MLMNGFLVVVVGSRLHVHDRHSTYTSAQLLSTYTVSG